MTPTPFRCLPGPGAAVLALLALPGGALAATCPPAAGAAALGQVIFAAPSAILAQSDLDAIATAHAACARDVASVEAVIEAINTAYEARGADLAYAEFGGTRGGRVVIDLVEIRYDQVLIQGAQRTRPDYLRARAGAEPGALADIRRLESRLARLPETDGLRVEADLRPGTRPGTTILTLNVAEPPAQRGFFGLDSTGAVDSGQARLSAGVTLTSLSGLADPLSLSVSRTEGSRQLALSYARPWGTEGARLSFGLSVERSEALFAPAPATGLLTSGGQVTVGLAHPLRADADRTDSLTLSATLALDASELGGVALSDTRTLEIALGSSHLRRVEGRALGLTHALRLGSVDDRVTPGSYTYARYEGSVFALAALGSDWSLGAEARWQYATDPLPAFAQFSATGRAGVRGYGRVAATNDAGAVARIELRRSPFDSGRLRLSPFGFADAGYGASHGAGGLTAGPLRASVGLGLDLSADLGRGRSLTGSLIAALPLVDALPRVRAGSPEIVAALTFGF